MSSSFMEFSEPEKTALFFDYNWLLCLIGKISKAGGKMFRFKIFYNLLNMITFSLAAALKSCRASVRLHKASAE